LPIHDTSVLLEEPAHLNDNDAALIALALAPELFFFFFFAHRMNKFNFVVASDRKESQRGRKWSLRCVASNLRKRV